MTLNLAVIGAGFMSQLAHIPNFSRIKDCKIIALCDKRKRLGKMVAEKYHIPYFYENYLDIVDRSDIDAAVVIVNDEMHAPISIDFLKSGKHVFVEKPMATNINDGEEMVSTARKTGVKLMIAYMKRYDAGCILAKNILRKYVEKEELGKIRYVRVYCYCGEWVCGLNKIENVIFTDEPRPRIVPRPPKWLDINEYNSFRGFNNVFCHDINLMRWFLGDPREILFSTFKEGFHCSIISYNDFNVVFETGSIRSHKWMEGVIIYFDKGWMRIETPPPLLKNFPAEIEIYDGENRIIKKPFGKWEWSFMNEAKHFIKCITEDVEPESSGEDSLKDVYIIEEIYKKYIFGK